MPMLAVVPERVDFGSDVIPARAYKETVTVTNTLSSPVVFSVRVSAPARLSVVPAECSLDAGESMAIQVKLNMSIPSGLKHPKAYRDTIYIQSTYFSQKVTCIFSLAADPPPRRFDHSSIDATIASGSGAGGGGGGSSAEVSAQHRVIVGGGPSAYRALLQAEFEEKSVKVLAILRAKDEANLKLEEDLKGSRGELEASRSDHAAAIAELEATKARLAESMRRGDEAEAELREARHALSQRIDPGPTPNLDAAAAAETRPSPGATVKEQQDQIEVLVAEIARLQDESRRNAEAARFHVAERDSHLWEKRVNGECRLSISFFFFSFFVG